MKDESECLIHTCSFCAHTKNTCCQCGWGPGEALWAFVMSQHLSCYQPNQSNFRSTMGTLTRKPLAPGHSQAAAVSFQLLSDSPAVCSSILVRYLSVNQSISESITQYGNDMGSIHLRAHHKDRSRSQTLRPLVDGLGRQLLQASLFRLFPGVLPDKVQMCRHSSQSQTLYWFALWQVQFYDSQIFWEP